MKATHLLAALILLASASPAFARQRVLTRTDGAVVAATAAEASGVAADAPEEPKGDGRYGAHLFPARGGGLDWGLALSGGGVRSAAFSIGAMKALYDTKDENGTRLLDKIDVISSVSGGGYAAYWLLTNYARNKSMPFGEAAFRDDRFVRNVCELQKIGKSKVVPNKKYFKILTKQLRGKSEAAFDEYKNALGWSFGNRKEAERCYEACETAPKIPGPLPSEESLQFLNAEIEALKVPYFIINTTVEIGRKDRKRNPRLKKPSSVVFEITPHFRGNPVIGFREWAAEKDEDEPSVIKSVAMSGAPKFFGLVGIEGEVANFDRTAVGGERLSLIDGGFSENLGALALIRRRIRNVVVIDAEADPAYKFDAYVKLQKMLKDEGIDFCVPNIEAFLRKPEKRCAVSGVEPVEGKKHKGAFSASSVSEGRATADDEGKTLVSNIYYVKMSLPEAILPDTFSAVDEDAKKCEYVKAGRGLENDRQCDLCGEKKEDVSGQAGSDCRKALGNRQCDCTGVSCLNCEKIDTGLDTEGYKKLYANVVWHYGNYLNRPGPFRLKLLTKSFNAAGATCYFLTKPWPLKLVSNYCSVLSYNFPHTTTLDQSLFSDQLEAFVGLGYLQTLQLNDTLRRRGRDVPVE
ncbi:MAG TPA: patatin-like phospholipase family protein [Pyrinomonadaceae bacterium]|jgi:hypothetical protein|nr:patatin-like phospholipase family protein [Pyrinomonadaceae bacterium]